MCRATFSAFPCKYTDIVFVYVTNDIPGGDGGAGGEGGNAGNIDISGFHQKPKFEVNNIRGGRGTEGNGMSGAYAVRHGEILELNYKYHAVLDYYLLIQKKRFWTGETAAGRDGSDGKNRLNIESPHEVKFQNSSNIVNIYKEYGKNHLVGNVLESNFNKFLTSLTTTRI